VRTSRRGQRLYRSGVSALIPCRSPSLDRGLPYTWVDDQLRSLPEDQLSHKDDESSDEVLDDDDYPIRSAMVRVVGFDEMEPTYANDIHVAADANTLHFIFTRFLPPPVVTESDRDRLNEVGFVPNHVVAHVIVPTYLAEKLLDLLPDRLGFQRELLTANESTRENENEDDDASHG